MQEKVTAQSRDFNDINVQWSPDLQSVGIALEPNTDDPHQHLLEALYGDYANRIEIGRIFVRQSVMLREDQKLVIRDFKDSEEENDFFAQLGQEILDAVMGSNATNGMWTWLNRPGINRLIRLLRKARDQAFGRDE